MAEFPDLQHDARRTSRDRSMSALGIVMLAVIAALTGGVTLAIATWAYFGRTGSLSPISTAIVLLGGFALVIASLRGRTTR